MMMTLSTFDAEHRRDLEQEEELSTTECVFFKVFRTFLSGILEHIRDAVIFSLPGGIEQMIMALSTSNAHGQ